MLFPRAAPVGNSEHYLNLRKLTADDFLSVTLVLPTLLTSLCPLCGLPEKLASSSQHQLLRPEAMRGPTQLSPTPEGPYICLAYTL